MRPPEFPSRRRLIVATTGVLVASLAGCTDVERPYTGTHDETATDATTATSTTENPRTDEMSESATTEESATEESVTEESAT